MAIRRACSWQATIKLPEETADYSAILVTVSQERTQIINRQIGDDGLTVSADSVILKLSQTETRLFTAGKPALLQVRAFKSEYDAPGSKIWPVDVYDSLNTEVLS